MLWATALLWQEGAISSLPTVHHVHCCKTQILTPLLLLSRTTQFSRLLNRYLLLLSTLVWSNVDVMPDGARSIIWILFQHASSECSRWSQRCSEIVDTLWGNGVVLVLSCPWCYRSIFQVLPQVYCIRVPPLKISAPAILTTRGHSLLTIRKHVGSRKWAINIMLLHVMMRYPLWSMMK